MNMTMRPLPPAASMREFFSYNAETGVLTWKPRPGPNTGWNTRYAGKAIATIDADGYVNARLKPFSFRVHRIAWAIMTGAWPTGDVDHINGVRSDNRWCNLRDVCRRDNNLNRHAPRRGKYPRGVCLHRKSGLFRSYLNLNGRQISFGYFKTPEEAAAEWMRRAPDLLGEIGREALYARP